MFKKDVYGKNLHTQHVCFKPSRFSGSNTVSFYHQIPAKDEWEILSVGRPQLTSWTVEVAQSVDQVRWRKLCLSFSVVCIVLVCQVFSVSMALSGFRCLYGFSF